MDPPLPYFLAQSLERRGVRSGLVEVRGWGFPLTREMPRMNGAPGIMAAERQGRVARVPFLSARALGVTTGAAAPTMW
jgi:hypothetical protein